MATSPKSPSIESVLEVADDYSAAVANHYLAGGQQTALLQLMNKARSTLEADLHALVRDSGAAAPPTAAVSTWLPIDTVPPGVNVFVFYRNRAGMGRTIKAMHSPRFTLEANEDCEDGVAEYHEALDRYTLVEGFWEQIDNWDEFTQVLVTEGEPTHWMPLPAEPL